MEYIILKDLEQYKIYKEGYVVKIKTGKRVTFSKEKKGYMKARLYTSLSKHKDGRKPYRLHRLIVSAFLDSYDETLQVNHKDGNKQNNHITNLEMMTASDNVYHAWNKLDSEDRRNKLSERRTGEKHSQETINKISKKALENYTNRDRNELGQFK